MCEVLQKFDSARELYIKTLNSNSMFGHEAVVMGSKNLNSVICKNYCTIASLSLEDYQ